MKKIREFFKTLKTSQRFQKIANILLYIASAILCLVSIVLIPVIGHYRENFYNNTFNEKDNIEGIITEYRDKGTLNLDKKDYCITLNKGKLKIESETLEAIVFLDESQKIIDVDYNLRPIPVTYSTFMSVLLFIISICYMLKACKYRDKIFTNNRDNNDIEDKNNLNNQDNKDNLDNLSNRNNQNNRKDLNNIVS